MEQQQAIADAGAGLEGPRIVGIAAVVFAIWTAGIVAWYGAGEEAARSGLRTTARTSTLLLPLAFGAAAAARRWPGSATRWLLRNRRYMGLSFATSHGFHTGFIIWLVVLGADGDVDATTRYAGGLGILAIAVMAATSNDASQRALGKRWRRLHLALGWLVWFVFFVSWAPGILAPEGHPIRASLMTAPLLALLVLRLWPAPRR